MRSGSRRTADAEDGVAPAEQPGSADGPSSSGRPATVNALLGAALRQLGVRRVVGASSDGITGIDGLAHTRVSEPSLAAVLAGAAGRVGPAPGVALLPGRGLLVTSVPGLVPAAPVPVTDAATLVEVLATWDHQPDGAAVELRLDLDLEAPVPDEVAVLEADHGAAGTILAPDMRGVGLVVLAGPGVGRAGRQADLQMLATRGGLPVVLTSGAAGLLDAGLPHLAGVAGLQAHDLTATGLDRAPVVVLTGVDAVELLDGMPGAPGGSAQVLEVDPAHLATLPLRWDPPDDPPPPPSALVTAMAAMLTGLDDLPRSPAAACRALATVARRDTVVAADAGPTGLWLARVPTPAVPGTLRLPGLRSPGFAVAAAMSAAMDGRGAIAVVTDPPDPVSDVLLELAGAWGLDVVVAVWGAGAVATAATNGSASGTAAAGSATPVEGSPGAGADDADRWALALRAARRVGGVQLVGLDVDLSLTRLLIGQFGPVEGWRSPGPDGGPGPGCGSAD
jgi:hypothetical protein